MITVRLVPGRELDAALVREWSAIRRANPHLQSPFFAPEFARIVASVRSDVEIAVIYQGTSIAGFLPFQRKPSDYGLGIPVANPISDFQGLICRTEFSCDPLDLVGKCELTAYEFDHFLSSQKQFDPYVHRYAPSPLIDVSGGYDAYVEEKKIAGSDLIKSCANLARRMEREVGPLKFIPHCADSRILEQILSLKSAQHIRTGARDIFAIEWIRNVIEQIHATQTSDLSGVLSLLYAGDCLVAGHFGMRSQTVWHYWFPAYNRDLARYSPGLNLILRMAAHCQSLGVTTIDLDRGNSLYKTRLMNRKIMVMQGRVDRRYSRRIALRAAWRTREALARSSIGPPTRALLRFLRHSYKSVSNR